jgi:hypothetical protein
MQSREKRGGQIGRLRQTPKPDTDFAVQIKNRLKQAKTGNAPAPFWRSSRFCLRVCVKKAGPV